MADNKTHSSKVSTSLLLYILGETSQHQQSFHHSVHPCQIRTVTGNNQLFP